MSSNIWKNLNVLAVVNAIACKEGNEPVTYTDIRDELGLDDILTHNLLALAIECGAVRMEGQLYFLNNVPPDILALQRHVSLEDL